MHEKPSALFCTKRIRHTHTHTQYVRILAGKILTQPCEAGSLSYLAHIPLSLPFLFFFDVLDDDDVEDELLSLLFHRISIFAAENVERYFALCICGDI